MGDLILDQHFEFLEKDRKWHCFFAAIHHREDLEIYKIWGEYSSEIGQYVIAKEIATNSHLQTAGEHFHFCAEMTPETYHKICKRLFKDKYNLSGQARNGKPKQYGKVSEIKNITRMIAYCLKDGDYITNIPSEDLEEYKKISFNHDKVKTVKGNQTVPQIVINKLVNQYGEYYDWEYERDCKKIMRVILEVLGETAKIFDERKLKQFYLGIFNGLRKTSRVEEDFLKTCVNWILY